MKRIVMNETHSIILCDHRSEQWARPWEKERIDAMIEAIGPKDVVFDIGAEEGDISALLSERALGTVLFEPSPGVWPNIKATYEANKLKPPLGCFVGFASNKQETEQSPPHPKDWPIEANGPIISDHGFRHLAQDEETPRISLDHYCKTTGIYPTVITMDIEGAELEALMGAEELLRERRPMVFVSIHPPTLWDWYNQTPEDVHEFMEGLGYLGEHIATDHEEHWSYR